MVHCPFLHARVACGAVPQPWVAVQPATQASALSQIWPSGQLSSLPWQPVAAPLLLPPDELALEELALDLPPEELPPTEVLVVLVEPPDEEPPAVVLAVVELLVELVLSVVLPLLDEPSVEVVVAPELDPEAAPDDELWLQPPLAGQLPSLQGDPPESQAARQTPVTQNQPSGQGASAHALPVGSMNGVEVLQPPARAAKRMKPAGRIFLKSSLQLPPPHSPPGPCQSSAPESRARLRSPPPLPPP